MRTSQTRIGLLIALFGLVAACSSRPTPVQIRRSTPPTSATSAPSPTITHRATVTKVAATVTPVASPLQDDWIHYENEHVQLSLPRGWQVIELTSDDAQAAFESMKRDNPQMAGIIASPDALQDAALWAFGPGDREFTENLNIRRSPLGAERITDMQEQVLDLVAPQLEKAGFGVLSSEANLRINGLPAAHVIYTLPTITADASPIEIRGHQYLVLSDSDLWILSYSTMPERDARMAPVFEQSARSFRPQ